MKPNLKSWGALLALLVLVGAVLASPVGASAHKQSTAQDLPRSTVDRPDDVSGPQVHLVYATPSDGPDRNFDTNGQLAAEWNVGDGWFASQAGGLHYRLDTYQGIPDVTFVRFSEPDSVIHARGDIDLSSLASVGLNNPNKIYLVYYEGSAVGGCGIGKTNMAIEYLNGFGSNYPPGTPGCATNVLVSPGSTFPDVAPGFAEIEAMHEMVHSTPPHFVAPCAPHYTFGNGDHVSDSNTDLMYAGSQPWDWQNAVLDYGHDDYFGEHVPAGCPNLQQSPYLTTQAFKNLTVKVVGDGTVSFNGNDCSSSEPCVFPLRTDLQVELTAEAGTGSVFSGWGGSCSGQQSCKLTMTGDASVTANFTAQPAKLMVTISGKGAVTSTGLRCASGPSRCLTSFKSAGTKKLAAKSAAGWQFKKWGGACKSTRPTCTVHLVNGKTTPVQAVFVKKPKKR